MERPLTPAGSRVDRGDGVGAVGVATLHVKCLPGRTSIGGPTHLLTSFNCTVCLLKEGLIRDSCSDSRESKRSACGTLQSETPAVVPICGHLDSFRSLMLGDVHIERGARERDLPKSIWGNPFKVAKYGRRMAIDEYAKTLVPDGDSYTRTWTLSGCRLVCHCTPNQACHADSLIERSIVPCFIPLSIGTIQPPDHHHLTFCASSANLREEPPENEGSSADEGAPPKDSGWRGTWTADVRRHRLCLPRILRHLLHQAAGPSRLEGIHRAQRGYVSLNGSRDLCSVSRPASASHGLGGGQSHRVAYRC